MVDINIGSKFIEYFSIFNKLCSVVTDLQIDNLSSGFGTQCQKELAEHMIHDKIIKDKLN